MLNKLVVFVSLFVLSLAACSGPVSDAVPPVAAAGSSDSDVQVRMPVLDEVVVPSGYLYSGAIESEYGLNSEIQAECNCLLYEFSNFALLIKHGDDVLWIKNKTALEDIGVTGLDKQMQTGTEWYLYKTSDLNPWAVSQRLDDNIHSTSIDAGYTVEDDSRNDWVEVYGGTMPSPIRYEENAGEWIEAQK